MTGRVWRPSLYFPGASAEVRLGEDSSLSSPGSPGRPGHAWHLAPDAEGERARRDDRRQWGHRWRLPTPSRPGAEPPAHHRGDDRPVRPRVGREHVRRVTLTRGRRQAVQLSIVAGVVVVAAGGTIAASTSAFRPSPPADYREAVVALHRPLSLDPLFDREDAAVRDAGHLLYASLLRLGADGRPVPDLAATWSVSTDGHTYAFTIPAGRRWSDGSALTARDVAA